MTENRTITNEDGSIGYQQDFDWNSKQQGLVLSSFFYGYACTQFIGGIMAARYGGHIVDYCSVIIIACLLSFFAYRFSAWEFL